MSSSEEDYSSDSACTEVFASVVETLLERGFVPRFDDNDEAQWTLMYDSLAQVVYQYFDEG